MAQLRMTRDRRPGLARRLRGDRRGLALIEFALTLPIIVLLALSGAEICHYTITRMRISQLALHVADNSARIGTGSRREAKKIYESDIYDLLDGAQMQSGSLDIMANGRVIVSSLEPMPGANPQNKSRVRWQRCAGAKTSHDPSWGGGNRGQIDGMGPAGRLSAAPADGVTMFVEIYYQYKPIVRLTRAPSTDMVEIASMVVRDRRDTNGGNDGVYPVAGVPPKTC